MKEGSLQKVLLIGKALSERKGKDLLILDVAKQSSFTDYFVLVSGRSIRQVQALADHVQEALREKKMKPLGVEGVREGGWVLLDYGDVIVHVFYEPTRQFYDLESLWSDAQKVAIDQ